MTTGKRDLNRIYVIADEKIESLLTYEHAWKSLHLASSAFLFDDLITFDDYRQASNYVANLKRRGFQASVLVTPASQVLSDKPIEPFDIDWAALQNVVKVVLGRHTHDLGKENTNVDILATTILGALVLGIETWCSAVPRSLIQDGSMDE